MTLEQVCISRESYRALVIAFGITLAWIIGYLIGRFDKQEKQKNDA